MNTYTYRVVAKPTDVVQSAERLLRRISQEHSGIMPVRKDDDGADLTLRLVDGIGNEGYRISTDTPGHVDIDGNDEQGLLYGVGKFLRQGNVETGTSVPAKPVRGVYFATHFHNWYHDAPIDKVIRYVEELALWGCNTLSVWFDMHHYSDMSDPRAVDMIARLRAVLKAASGVGIKPSLTSLANEGYSTTPPPLKADHRAGQNGYHHPPAGHYRVEICPSAPGGLDLILKHREQMLEVFSDIDLGYYWIWPYDQGGCTCAKCAPWGSNGFLRTAKPVAELVKSTFPDVKIVLSTWYFDHFVPGEWEGISSSFAGSRPDWIDYLLVDDFGGFPEYPLANGIPGDFPVVGFPEISMEGMFPWGGFGANPRPTHWQKYHDVTKGAVSGGFPYSEGIYEDLNKVLMLGLQWNPEQSVEEIIREYVSGYFSKSQCEGITRAIQLMERNHGAHAEIGLKDAVYTTPGGESVEECFCLMGDADKTLGDTSRRSWRWRVLWLRSALDFALKESGGKPNELTQTYFQELIEIYHAHHAEGAVHPPLSGV